MFMKPVFLLVNVLFMGRFLCL